MIQYCPALPRIRYRPARPSRDTFVETAIPVLLSNQTVFISGRDHDHVEAWVNAKIYKTTSVNRDLRPALERRGLSTAYTNAGDLSAYSNQGKILPSGKPDFLFIDEAHMIVPEDFDCRRDQNKVIMEFWERVETLMEGGTKIVYISAFHPFHPYYGRNKEYPKRIMLTLFTSPVIELPPRKTG